MLLLYTDGAIKARNEKGEQYSLQRPAADLAENFLPSPGALMDQINSNIRAFARREDLEKYPGNMADDIS